MNDKCQVHGFNLGDVTGDATNVNVFNFFGPVYGNIHGLDDDDDDNGGGDNGGPAQEGETCEGFDESTGGPFPSCADGLVCEDAG